MEKRARRFILKASRLFFSRHPMSDEAAGVPEMIDGPCKYGYYHIGSPRPSPHYSLTVGATTSP